MHIEFLVEELSAEEALRNIVPHMISNADTFDIHAHQGKTDLLEKLPGRLRGYKSWIPSDWRIVILLDVDDDICLTLKQKLENIACTAGFITKSSACSQMNFQVVNRIAIEELEAWFFGDITAVNAAYPRISTNIVHKAKYRNPDAILGGTWEALETILQKAGYFKGGMPKTTVAREISTHMLPMRNISHSFQVFYAGIIALLGACPSNSKL